MPKGNLWRILVVVLACAVGQLMLANTALAAPHVKVVPWVSTNPLIPHDTWSGKSIRLKGTSDIYGGNLVYWWNFGDGNATAEAPVTSANYYALEAAHAYTGTAGTVFVATLTVRDTGTAETDSKNYYVQIQDKSLNVEVNVAIDEGLWYLHKAMTRAANGLGYWYTYPVGSGYPIMTALNVNAFEVNGHLESGSPDNPYTETVARGLKWLFTTLYSQNIALQTTPLGQFNPDTNGNGIGLLVNSTYPPYQGGSVVDAIIASGTPSAVTTSGPANVLGRTYKDIVQDLADWYFWSQNDVNPGGGWRYYANYGSSDNSVCQWAAIALIPAEREWGITVPQIVKDWNKVWLTYSLNAAGFYGYTDPGYLAWGSWATTPSGMVQAVMDGVGRGNPLWDKAETYMRNNFGNTGGAYYAVKDYYYGLFSFAKALLLYPCPTPAACGREPGDTAAYGIKMLQSSTAGVLPIDWYAAEVSKGDPTDGVARTLVSDQDPQGYWINHSYSGDQIPMETGIAIIILNRTIFTAGAPVAVAKATPNPAVANETITLDGGASYHQDSKKHIVAWQWDIDNDGDFELTGPAVTTSYPLGTYPVKLRVTDDATPSPATAETTISVIVTIPPVAPTANAGGPYNFCMAPVGAPAPKWFLDGSKSVNPDEGTSEPHTPPYPGDTIFGDPSQFKWKLGTAFGDAIGVKPDVTAWVTGKGVGQYLIELKVTDTSALSFPSSPLGDLSSTATAYVYVKPATDPGCTGCIKNLTALSKNRLVQLTWTLLAGTDHYNVYRGSAAGGPYTLIGTATGTQTVYFDTAVTNGLTYYYVVRPAALNNAETCQSNEVVGKPRALR